jgi:transposase
MEAVLIMMGKTQQLEPKLFYHGLSLERRIPSDHPLRRIQQVVDFTFIRSQVADLYGSCGHTSVDPVVLLKLMFLLFYENVKSERQLMAQLPMRLDWLWFCGYDIDDQTPDHSVLSKARRRWGAEVFSTFFETILTQCVQAGLVDGEIIHVDSSMIDANASKDSLQCQVRLVSDQLYDQLEQTSEPDKPLEKHISTTDPDARLSKKKYSRTTLGYKDHRSVDDKAGIVTATVTTPANMTDDKVLTEVIEQHQHATGKEVEMVAADMAYGTGENYKMLHEQGITPCISHQQRSSRCHPDFNHDKFIYDAKQDCYLCPAGQKLPRHQEKPRENSIIYRADRQTCQSCRHLKQCVSSQQFGRQIRRNVNTEHIEWADGCLSKYERKRLMARRKYKAEGSFADAANNHGFKRCRLRGIEKATIQNQMIAAIQNLRKLLRAINLKPAAGACKRLLERLKRHTINALGLLRNSEPLETVI